MNSLKKVGLLTAMVLTLGASSAFAEVVCNQDGDCWRTKERRTYGPELKLRVFPDTWKWGTHENNKYRWRDHGNGHGYYRQGVWVEIK